MPASLSPATNQPVRLGVWAGDGNNTHFLDPILDRLPDRYRVQRFTWSPDVPDDLLKKQLDRVDVAWFEWGIGPVLQASKLTTDTPTLCRIHRYEVYTPFPRKITWENVDCLVLISDYVKEMYSELQQGLPPTRIEIVPNAVATKDYAFRPDRKKNFNLGFLGRLHYVKNPMLLMQILKKVVEIDPRYQLHIAGGVQQVEIAQYLVYQANQMGIADHVHTYGQLNKNDVRSFLEQCCMILCTSVIEGHPVGLMEAMASGCKPIVHDFPGARHLFDDDFLFNSVDEAADLIVNGAYEPKRYRSFIEDRYDIKDQVRRITELLDSVVAGDASRPLALAS